MRIFWSFIVFLISATSAVADGSAWFNGLSQQQRFVIQADLVLTGDYEGMMDGVFGPGTNSALSTFQQRMGSTPTGALSDQDLQKLQSAAATIFNKLGMVQINDVRTGLSMYLPKGVLTREGKTPDGSSYASSDGGIVVHTLSRPLDDAKLTDVMRGFQSLSDGTHITYSKIAGNLLVVSGKGPTGSYYTRLVDDGGRLVGYEVNWTPSYSDLGPVTAVFAASTVAPVSVGSQAAPDTASSDVDAADATREGAWALPANDPQTIVLDGDITQSTPIDFLRALHDRPTTTKITLNSNGGLVVPAILVAHEVHSRGLATEVRSGQGCYSACAYIFFAGLPRTDQGQLGVHEVYGDKATAEDAQMSLSDVLDALKDFDVSQGVISVMLRTPPDQIHVFTDAEITSLDINKTRDGTNSVPPSSSSVEPVLDPQHTAGEQSLLIEASDDTSKGASPYAGSLSWSAGVDNNGAPTVTAKVAIPQRGLSLDLVFRKNTDPDVSAADLIELNFETSQEFAGGSIVDVPGVLLKNDEFSQGVPLVGSSTRVVADRYLFQLGNAQADVSSNDAMLKDRKWIDIALVYASGRRAIVTLERNDATIKLFYDTLASWKNGKLPTKLDTVVQLFSESSSEAAVDALQKAKLAYQADLGDHTLLISPVDLGAKGQRYRVRTEPMTEFEAAKICSDVRMAGGECVITPSE